MCKCNSGCCCKKSSCTIITLISICFALLVGVLANVSDAKGVMHRVVASTILFFDAMIPILGVAALIKFLLTSGKGENCCCEDQKGCCEDQKDS